MPWSGAGFATCCEAEQAQDLELHFPTCELKVGPFHPVVVMPGTGKGPTCRAVPSVESCEITEQPPIMWGRNLRAGEETGRKMCAVPGLWSKRDRGVIPIRLSLLCWDSGEGSFPISLAAMVDL